MNDGDHAFIRNISGHNYVFLTQYIPSFHRNFSVNTFKFPETLRTISRSGDKYPFLLTRIFNELCDISFLCSTCVANIAQGIEMSKLPAYFCNLSHYLKILLWRIFGRTSSASPKGSGSAIIESKMF